MKKSIPKPALLDNDGKKVVCSMMFFDWFVRKLEGDDLVAFLSNDFENAEMNDFANNFKAKNT